MVKVLTRETLIGSAGTGTELSLEMEVADPPDWSATLASWFLHCPGQSPAWDDYLLSVIHLRPIAGVKPAVISVAAATHEILLVALDPTKCPRPDNVTTWSHLRPVNLMEQVQLPDDDAAVDLLREAAQAVLDGRLWAEAPLAGQVEPWRTVLIKTSAHLRGEEHAP